jgi:hypothetical protein
MNKFDDSQPAELFTVSGPAGRRVQFRRYETAAQALQFAMEEFNPRALVGTVLQVEEERLDHREIRRLYNDENYPLARKNERVVSPR